MKKQPMMIVGIIALVVIGLVGLVWARSRGNKPEEQVWRRTEKSASARELDHD